MSNEESSKVPSGQSASAPDAQAELKRFLEGFSALPAAIEKGMLAQAQDEDEKAVILAYATPLKEQIVNLSAHIAENARGISRTATADLGDVLRIGAATTMVAQAHNLSTNLAAPSAKLGVSGLIEMIKKLIRKILELFNIKLPAWIDKILDLIDEILNWLLSGGNAAMQSTLSKVHQNYLAELVQVARLERESQWQYAGKADEE